MAASVAVVSPGSRAGGFAGLIGRVRAIAWRRWLVAAMAFNIALGMGLSVVALRHQADARARADVLLADLDSAVSSQEAQLWRAVAADAPGVGTSFEDAAVRVDDAAARVSGSAAVLADDSDVFAALASFRAQARAIADDLTVGGHDASLEPAVTALTPAATWTRRKDSVMSARRDSRASQSAGSPYIMALVLV